MGAYFGDGNGNATSSRGYLNGVKVNAYFGYGPNHSANPTINSFGMPLNPSSTNSDPAYTLIWGPENIDLSGMFTINSDGYVSKYVFNWANVDVDNYNDKQIHIDVTSPLGATFNIKSKTITLSGSITISEPVYMAETNGAQDDGGIDQASVQSYVIGQINTNSISQYLSNVTGVSNSYLNANMGFQSIQITGTSATSQTKPPTAYQSWSPWYQNGNYDQDVHLDINLNGVTIQCS